MNAAGECCVGVPALAAIAGKPLRTTERAVAKLQEAGHITVKRKSRGPAVIRWDYDMTTHRKPDQPTTPNRHSGGGSKAFPNRHSGGGSDGNPNRQNPISDPPLSGGANRHRVADRKETRVLTRINEKGHSRSQESEEKPKGTGGEPVSIRTKLTAFLTPPAADAADTPSQAST